MSNMSYCRFENTLADMKDCLNAIEEAGGISNYIRNEDPSAYELQAMTAMIEVAEELAGALKG